MKLFLLKNCKINYEYYNYKKINCDFCNIKVAIT